MIFTHNEEWKDKSQHCEHEPTLQSHEDESRQPVRLDEELTVEGSRDSS